MEEQDQELVWEDDSNFEDIKVYRRPIGIPYELWMNGRYQGGFWTRQDAIDASAKTRVKLKKEPIRIEATLQRIDRSVDYDGFSYRVAVFDYMHEDVAYTITLPCDLFNDSPIIVGKKLYITISKQGLS